MIVILSKKAPHMLKKAFSEIKAKNIKNFVFISTEKDLKNLVSDYKNSLLLFSHYPVFLDKENEVLEFVSAKELQDYLNAII